MKSNLSRREALRLLVLGSGAVLAGCGRRAEPLALAPQDPTAAPSAPPPSASPVPSFTPSPRPSATASPTVAPPTATRGPAPTVAATSEPGPTGGKHAMSVATVYITRDISAEGLVKIYEALGRKATGKVAVKVHSGEPSGQHFLSPELIAPLVREVDGTLVECNTAYGGRRANAASHLAVMEEHGFTAIAPVDIMDAEGTMSVPIVGGKHLQEAVVGAHFADYDFCIDLAHFKGHQMGGFGGVIKNMSIGIASSMGKSLIHSAGKAKTGLSMDTPQNDFLESMAEAAKGIADHLGENILYIDVMNNLSVDCDCNGNPAAPTMADIGILASLDPVAVDQACVDLVDAAADGQALVQRIESRKGIHTLEHAEAIGLGSRTYELIDID